MARSVGGDLEHAQIVRPGAVLGSVSSAWTAGPAAIAATGVSVTAWPGTPVTVTVTPRPLAHAISLGQPVAETTVTIGSQVSHITLDASQSRACTVDALALHPAPNGPEPKRNPAKARTHTRRAALGPLFHRPDRCARWALGALSPVLGGQASKGLEQQRNGQWRWKILAEPVRDLAGPAA